MGRHVTFASALEFVAIWSSNLRKLKQYITL